MVSDALKQLQDQIEAVRTEAYREGFAAAMAAVLGFVQGAPHPSYAIDKRKPPTARLNGGSGLDVEVDIFGGRPRGDNRKLVLEELKPIAPRAIGPTALIKLINRRKGLDLQYSSVRNGLRQLEELGLVQQVGDTKTWRYIGPQQTEEPSPEAPGNGSV